MRRKKPYRRLSGSSAYYPYGVRKSLRSIRRRKSILLWVLGLALLGLTVALSLRQSLFHGGQPTAPSPVQSSASSPAPVALEIKPATADVLAATGGSESDTRTTPASAEDAADSTVENILPQYRELYAQNADMIGWLKLGGTEIDYPVLQTPGNNEYYLRRGFDRLYSTAGSLFLDERCSLGGSTPATANWLIYGHNMGDHTMFSQLGRYADRSFFTLHPTFRFDTLTAEGTWQVAAVLRTTLGADELPYYGFFDAANEDEWQRQVDAIMALSLYPTGVTPMYGQQLLTLSTCGNANPGTNERLAVLAVRVDE